MSFKHFFLSLLLFCTGFSTTFADSFEIPEIRIEVSVNFDGTIQITEHLTYAFDGDFSWGEYQLPKEGYSAISDIKVSEEDQTYINKNSEETGTFSIAESDDAIRVKWHYNAEDERRTFTISYTLEGALTVGPEWSQFFWNYVSENRDKSTEQLAISINLPKSVSTDSLYGWTRGPEGQIDLQESTENYQISATNINDDEYVKVRAVFPTDVLQKFQAAANNKNFTLTQAQQEEQTYQKERAEQQERQVYLADLWEKLNYLIALFSIGIFYFLYSKYGKRYPTSSFSSRETIMRPGNNHPATIGWLLQNRTISGGLLMSTVLDLARRGYFKIEEQPPENGFWKDDKSTFDIERTNKQAKQDLKTWERQLIDFIEDQIANDHQNLHELFKDSSSSTTKWVSKWKKNFKDYCFNQGWVDEGSYIGMYWNLGIQLLLLGSSIAAIVFAGPIALLSVFTTAIALISSFAIIRRTQKGEQVYHRWKNYKEGLKNAENHSISSDNLGKHFIFGVAFGLQEKEIENLITSSTDGTPALLWFILNGNTSSAASVASSFSTLSATGTYSFSSAAGSSGASASAAGGGASASAG